MTGIVSFTACHYNTEDKETYLREMFDSLFLFNVDQVYISISYDPMFKDSVSKLIMKLSYDTRIHAIVSSVKLHHFEHLKTLYGAISGKNNIRILFIGDEDILTANVPDGDIVVAEDFSGTIAHISIIERYFKAWVPKLGFEEARLVTYLSIEAQKRKIPQITNTFMAYSATGRATWDQDVVDDLNHALDKSTDSIEKIAIAKVLSKITSLNR